MGSAGSVLAGGSGSGSTGLEIVGGLIFEIGGSTERVSLVAAGSLFLGRLSSISETVSGFWGGLAGEAGDSETDVCEAWGDFADSLAPGACLGPGS